MVSTRRVQSAGGNEKILRDCSRGSRRLLEVEAGLGGLIRFQPWTHVQTSEEGRPGTWVGNCVVEFVQDRDFEKE